MTFGSLFAGIGGFDLGFERAGMRCVWQVEIDPYCRRVLAKHWPDVRRHDDVRTFPPTDSGEWAVDVICGGFPCQDISYAGRGAGLAGERSGLFFQAVRVVQQLRPRFVVLENVAALLTRGLDRVLGTLAEIGFDAEWHCIPAAAVGAPHIRERVFVLAYPARGDAGRAVRVDDHLARTTRPREWPRLLPEPSGSRAALAHPQGFDGVTDCPKSGGPVLSGMGGNPGGAVADSVGNRLEGVKPAGAAKGPTVGGGGWWATEPGVGRVADGVPARVDRLRGLGNAVVPQVAQFIGERLMAAAH